MKNCTLISIFLVIASLIGYRLISDSMDDTKNFR